MTSRPEAIEGVESPGSGLFVRIFRQERGGRRSAAFGYVFAGLAAAISGICVYVNSLGVRSFSDPLL